MIPIEDVQERVLALAEESPTKTIAGGRLAELLKHHLPGFTVGSYGTKSLRAFIRQHLAGKLDEVAKVGADIVYGLPGAIPPQTQVRATSKGRTIPQEVLRVYRSPNARFELHANRDTGEIRAQPEGSPIQEPCVRINRATPDFLRQVAKHFTSRMPDDNHDRLMRVLDEYPHAWWPAFSSHLREKNLYPAWAAFKDQQLRSKLEAELCSQGVSHSNTSDEQDSTLDEERRPPEFPRRAGSGPDEFSDDLRDVVIRAVQGLPLSELRNLRLPVGDVYDALKHRR